MIDAKSPPAEPWGAFAPSAFERVLLAGAAAAPRRGPAHLVGAAQRNLMSLWRRGPVDVEVYGFKARLHPAVNLADKRALYTPDHWEPMERKALEAIITPGFKFIDIGANSGLYSLFVAARAGPDAVVVAVEPQPEVAGWLAFNIAANDFETIHRIDAAVAGGPGRVELTLPDGNRGAASIVDKGARTVEVETVGLLDLMDRFGIDRADAIKLDIEGAEDQVLGPFLAVCPPERLPGHVFMETLSEHWRVDCVELLKQAGYVVREHSGRNAVLARAEGAPPAPGKREDEA